MGLKDLLTRAKDGDRQALEAVLVTLRPYMEDVARDYADPTRAAESTADLVQEAWVRTWQKLHLFEPATSDDETRAALHAWVGQIIHRLGLNMRRDSRAQKRHPENAAIVSLEPAGAGSASGGSLPAPDSGPTPSAVVSRNEEALRIQKAIDGIADPLDRAILQLRFFEELPLTEVARRLEMSYDRAVYRYRSLIESLERELGDLS